MKYLMNQLDLQKEEDNPLNILSLLINANNRLAYMWEYTLSHKECSKREFFKYIESFIMYCKRPKCMMYSILNPYFQIKDPYFQIKAKYTDGDGSLSVDLIFMADQKDMFATIASFDQEKNKYFITRDTPSSVANTIGYIMGNHCFQRGLQEEKMLREESFIKKIRRRIGGNR